jgi:NAD(P)-dependent dehydrogenase (short-subunit alcohol dehydrogenase family)
MHSPPKAVLVTGASSGIGRATAELLAASGYRVLAGVRCTANGSAPPPTGTETVLLDVTCRYHVECVLEQLRRTCPDGLYGLINNAGVAPPAAVELADLDEVRRILEVNTLAPLQLIQACLPLLRRAQGRVVNMSSMNGAIAMPMVGAYSASKFALEALSDALRVELRPWGISVSVIRPGQVRTAIFAKARAALGEREQAIPPELADGYRKLYARAGKFNERGASAATTPDAVARAVLKALTARRPRPIYVVGLDARGLHLAYRLLPTWLMDGVLARAMGLMRLPRSARRAPTPVEGALGGWPMRVGSGQLEAEAKGPAAGAAVTGWESSLNSP